MDAVVGTFLTGFSFTLVSITQIFLRPTGNARRFIFFLYFVLIVLAIITISQWPPDPIPWQFAPKSL